MRVILLALVIALAGPGPSAQQPSLYVGPEAPSPSVWVLPSVQQVSLSGTTITQVAVPFDVFVPFAPTWAAAVRGVYGSAGGDVPDLDGFGDVHLVLSHLRAIGSGAVVASVLANVPTGHRTLSLDEAETAFLVGQGFYGFRVPSLGQGFNLTPGVTAAFPVGRDVSVGAGLAYQVKGAFAPVEGVVAEYDPSDELLLTTGFEAELSGPLTWALDLTVSFYGEDQWDGEVFEPGPSATLTSHLRAVVGATRLEAIGHYASREPGEVVGAGLRFGPDGTVPQQARAIVLADAPLGRGVAVRALAQARYFATTDLFDDKLVYDLRLTPSVGVGASATVLGRFGVTFGDVEGFEVGAGLAWEL